MTAARLLVVDDEPDLRTLYELTLLREGYEIDSAGSVAEALELLQAGSYSAVITDMKLPDGSGLALLRWLEQAGRPEKALVITAFGSAENAVEALKAGAYDYLTKPVDLRQFRLVVGSALGRVAPEPAPVVKDAAPAPAAATALRLVGESPAIRAVRSLIDKVARSMAPVLVQGESGTGKELVARALHDYGRRRTGPFVPVNMAAIPRDLIESELFGHEKGAFTGALQRSAGRFEQAEGGTLFLDEIGDMPMEAQTRLLRVLQQGEYTTVGGRVPIRTNVRIIAATNKDLRVSIQQGIFREDLFFRLNVVPLRLPALRERSEDVPDLVRHFFVLVEREGLTRKTLDGEAMEKLKRYRWPGNVRELENLVRRLAALYPQETITGPVIEAELDTLPLAQPAAAGVANGSGRKATGEAETLSSAVERHLSDYFSGYRDTLPPPGLYHRILREIEGPLIGAALAATRGNQIRAAELLGVNRNTLRKKVRDLDLQVFRSAR